jgi:hypothetical protein
MTLSHAVIGLCAITFAPLAAAQEETRPFDADWLRGEAKRISKIAFDAPPAHLPGWIDNLD